MHITRPNASKQTIIIVGIAVVLVGLASGTAWLYSNKDASTQANQQSSQPAEAETETMLGASDKPVETLETTPETAAAPPPDAATPQSTPAPPQSQAQPGTYQTYSSAAISSAGDRSRVLFFHAPWCPQCRQLEADIKARGVPEGIAIFKIDYDSNQGLRQQYGVTQQTTVVSVNAGGSKIKSFLPYSKPTLANALSGLGL